MSSYCCGCVSFAVITPSLCHLCRSILVALLSSPSGLCGGYAIVTAFELPWNMWLHHMQLDISACLRNKNIFWPRNWARKVQVNIFFIFFTLHFASNRGVLKKFVHLSAGLWPSSRKPGVQLLLTRQLIAAVSCTTSFRRRCNMLCCKIGEEKNLSDWMVTSLAFLDYLFISISHGTFEWLR